MNINLNSLPSLIVAVARGAVAVLAVSVVALAYIDVFLIDVPRFSVTETRLLYLSGAAAAVLWVTGNFQKS